MQADIEKYLRKPRFNFYFLISLTVLYIVMGLTGLGMTISGITLGAFPHLLLYLLWLYFLARGLQSRMHIHAIKISRLDKKIRLLLITMLVILPLYMALLNFELRRDDTYLFIASNFFVLIYFVYFYFVTWTALAKALRYVTTRDPFSSEFDHYSPLFFLFLFGPVTIWWLEPVILKALEAQPHTTK